MSIFQRFPEAKKFSERVDAPARHLNPKNLKTGTSLQTRHLLAFSATHRNLSKHFKYLQAFFLLIPLMFVYESCTIRTLIVYEYRDSRWTP